MSDRRANNGERSGDRQSDSGVKKTPLKESRKFQVLAMVKQASKDDLLSLAKWMGASLSPAFMAYIGGVALEDASAKKNAGS